MTNHGCLLFSELMILPIVMWILTFLPIILLSFMRSWMTCLRACIFCAKRIVTWIVSNVVDEWIFFEWVSHITLIIPLCQPRNYHIHIALESQIEQPAFAPPRSTSNLQSLLKTRIHVSELPPRLCYIILVVISLYHGINLCLQWSLTWSVMKSLQNV